MQGCTAACNLQSTCSLCSSNSAPCRHATCIVTGHNRSYGTTQSTTLPPSPCMPHRCAILLEELDNYRGLRKGMALGHIVVETQTSNAVPLLYYSCSRRVMALPTGRLNARRVGVAATVRKRPVRRRLWLEQAVARIPQEERLFAVLCLVIQSLPWLGASFCRLYPASSPFHKQQPTIVTASAGGWGDLWCRTVCR